MKKTEIKNEIKLSRWEKETVINFNDEEDKAALYTCEAVIIRRMDKLVSEFPQIFKVTEEVVCNGKLLSKTYEFPKKYITIKAPIILSEERKEELRRQLERARTAKEKEGMGCQRPAVT